MLRLLGVAFWGDFNQNAWKARINELSYLNEYSHDVISNFPNCLFKN